MAIFLFTNNSASTLAAAIGPASTTIQLATGTGVLFPAPATGQQFALTLNDLATRTAFEVVYCTARSGDTLTVLRGQEGTTPLSWVIGDLCWNGPTSGTMASFVQIQHMTDGSISPVFNTGTFNGAVSATNQATITGTTVSGAVLRLLGNGATTPNKFIRALSGNLEWVNSAFSAVIGRLSDLGDLTLIRNMTVTQRLHAGLGAFGSGDNTVAAILGDWAITNLGGGAFLYRDPNGRIIQTFGTSIFGTVINQLANFPVAFPSACTNVYATFGSSLSLGFNGAAPQATLGATVSSNAQYLLSNTGFNPGSAYGVNMLAIGF